MKQGPGRAARRSGGALDALEDVWNPAVNVVYVVGTAETPARSCDLLIFNHSQHPLCIVRRRTTHILQSSVIVSTLVSAAPADRYNTRYKEGAFLVAPAVPVHPSPEELTASIPDGHWETG